MRLINLLQCLILVSNFSGLPKKILMNLFHFCKRMPLLVMHQYQMEKIQIPLLQIKSINLMTSSIFCQNLLQSDKDTHLKDHNLCNVIWMNQPWNQVLTPSFFGKLSNTCIQLYQRLPKSTFPSRLPLLLLNAYLV